MDDVPVSPGKIQLIESRHRDARVYALSIVNTPNYGELKRVWKANRKAQYAKYYNMFKSYPVPGGIIPFSDKVAFNLPGWQNS